MNKTLLQKIISETIKEVLAEANIKENIFDDDENKVKPEEISQVVDFLNSPENWLAAADAVSHGRGKEEDLIDFVKIHEPFNRWSWNKVKDAIETADANNLLGEFRTKRTIAENVLKAISSVVSEIDRGDVELQQSAAVDDLKKK